MSHQNQTAIAGRRAVLTQMMSSSACMGATVGVLGAVCPTPAKAVRAQPVGAELQQEWQLFKLRFVAADGRVIDTGNGGCSHSEGQGWGLLFAVAFDDPDTFDRILGWTARNLRRETDALHAWRYLPGRAVPVADTNSATDADLFIALALWRAARRWGRPDHASAARSIARDVLRLAVREAGPRTVLLPGATGFEFADCVAVNPSYYVFPAMTELAEAAPSPLWARLCADGLALLEEGRFGHWQLPPDWLRVSRADGALAPHPRWPARFSYDAIRVPLWLAWSGVDAAPVRQSFAAFWNASHPAPPAWVDLNTNATAAYPAPPGMVAVAQIATIGTRADVKAQLTAAFPALRTSPDYYSAALILLARLAWRESQGA